MLTVHDRSGRTFIFMDFFPCKAKDLPAKMAKLTATVEKYRGDNNGRTNTNKAHRI